jgi:hypothetical protein
MKNPTLTVLERFEGSLVLTVAILIRNEKVK